MTFPPTPPAPAYPEENPLMIDSDPPKFPHAIVNPAEVYVYLDPAAPDAASYPDGIGMGCLSVEDAEAMFGVEGLTRGFPWWTRALLLERADGGRPAIVLAQRTRDLTVTTWRRPDPSGS